MENCKLSEKDQGKVREFSSDDKWQPCTSLPLPKTIVFSTSESFDFISLHTYCHNLSFRNYTDKQTIEMKT